MMLPVRYFKQRAVWPKIAGLVSYAECIELQEANGVNLGVELQCPFSRIIDTIDNLMRTNLCSSIISADQ